MSLQADIQSLMGIPARVAELEQQLAELQATPQADALQPGVYTINAAGETEARISGHSPRKASSSKRAKNPPPPTA
jgi:hypothetical protein